MKTQSTHSFSVALLAAVVATLLLAGPAVAQPAEAETTDASGFIYGTVTTDKGKKFTGTLRWDDEEAFWGDLFNSAKQDMPWLDRYQDRKKRDDEGRQINVLGRKIKLNWGHHSTGRQFVARFGDISRIEVLGGDEANLFMRDGTKVHVEGSANDVSADIAVDDDALGEVVVPWRHIDTIAFADTPRDVKTRGFRLHGIVETTEGTFTGFVQWDSEECLSYDKLDGDDGDVDLSIDMGKIKSIERASRRASKVTLWDGRSMELSGSNDVDDDIRGILVEDERFGRIEVDWDAFRKVTFSGAGASGPSYASFNNRGPLQGTVRDTEGNIYRGEIIFDLDEAYPWEMLDGDNDDISYTIPFGMVTSVTPRGSDGATVVLRSGEELVLEDTQDVSDRNDGIVVLLSGDESVHVDWDDLEIVTFDHQ